jgi:hypothetical protein
MSMRANVINRVVLTVLGLLLLTVGALGLALGAGAFGAWRATYPVLPLKVSTFPDGRPWFWWAVGAVLFLVAVLALLWLLAQFKTDRTTRVDCTTDARDGYTLVHARALTKAVEDEALGITGVTSASANVQRRRRQHLFLRLGLADSADLGEVRTRLEDEVVAHLRAGVGDPEFPVTIELRPGSGKTPQRSVL